MTLAEKIINYRTKNLISQGEMARRCGVAVMTINAIENGKTNPSLLTESKIRKVIDKGGKK